MPKPLQRLLLAFVLGSGTLVISQLVYLNGVVKNAAASRVAQGGTLRYVAPPPGGDDLDNDCSNQNAPCATVQQAVDVAQAGDEIRVATGVYTDVSARNSALFTTAIVTQTVYISKPLTVRGGYSPADWETPDPSGQPTVIDAQGQGRVFNIEASTTITPISVTLEGISITGGTARGQVSALDLEAGGGIHGGSVVATLRHNTIYNNEGGQAGGGVALAFAGGTARLIDNIISNNRVSTTHAAAFGGGVVVVAQPSAQVNLSGNTIRVNRLTLSGAETAKGGGAYIIADQISLDQNIIQANVIETGEGAIGVGGGLSFDGSGRMAMANSVIVDNQILGAGHGAGFSVEGGRADGWQITIARNQGGDGSGLLALTGTVALTNVILAGQTTGISIPTPSQAMVKGVLWSNVGQTMTGTGLITASNELTGDAAFGGDGYHLTTASAAIDNGITPTVSIDIDGDARGALPDLGADEVESESEGPVYVYLPLVQKLWPKDTPTTPLLFDYGIQADPWGDGTANIGHIQTLGLNWVRFQMAWKFVEPTPGGYTWGRWDDLVGAYNANGLNILLSIPKAPDWARPPDDDKSVEGMPQDPAKYAEFVARVADRYRDRVQIIEIWNEPNLWYEAGGMGRIDGVAYTELLKLSYQAIKSANQDMIVISAGLAPAGTVGDAVVDDTDYLEQMYANGARDYLDAVGAHPAGFNCPALADWRTVTADEATATHFLGPFENRHHSWCFLGTMEGYRQVMKTNGDGAKPIIPTEFSWGVSDDSPAGYEYAQDNTYEEQAQWLVEAYQWGQQQSWVGPMFLWNLDYGLTAPGTELALFSLLTPDGPVPAYDAIVNLPK